jgi:hypothetical protein
MTPTLTPLQQLMFSLIKIWETSGKTQQDFCQEKDLSYAKFHYWHKRYREHFSPSSSQDTPFVSVMVKKEPEERAFAGAVMELFLPDGRRVFFNQAVKAGFLKALLQ